MVAGQVVASGTSLFLKHRFGRGYTITAVNPASATLATMKEGLLDSLRRVVPETALLSQAATETKLSVPLAQAGHFPELVRAPSRHRSTPPSPRPTGRASRASRECRAKHVGGYFQFRQKLSRHCHSNAPRRYSKLTLHTP